MKTLNYNQLRMNLALALQYMQASAGLLELAMRCLPAEQKDLHDYFLKHHEEECHHAQWLEEDLEGFSLAPHPIAVAMAGSAYYYVKHITPAALLGYMKVLEMPIPLEKVEELEHLHGKKLLRTVRVHAEEDPKHHSELLDMIVKQSRDDRYHIGILADWTGHYARQINELVVGVH